MVGYPCVWFGFGMVLVCSWDAHVHGGAADDVYVVSLVAACCNSALQSCGLAVLQHCGVQVVAAHHLAALLVAACCIIALQWCWIRRASAKWCASFRGALSCCPSHRGGWYLHAQASGRTHAVEDPRVGNAANVRWMYADAGVYLHAWPCGWTSCSTSPTPQANRHNFVWVAVARRRRTDMRAMFTWDFENMQQCPNYLNIISKVCGRTLLGIQCESANAM